MFNGSPVVNQYLFERVPVIFECWYLGQECGADVADYSEWTIGRRFTGMVFATIGFALKSGLALGSASFLWIMGGSFYYDTSLPSTPGAVAGYRFTSGIAVGFLFVICAALLLAYKLPRPSPASAVSME